MGGVEVSNPAVIRATRVPKVGLELSASISGISDVKITCKDGSTYEFRVHATRGAEIYSTNRNEPEHFQWSLTSTPREKPAASAPKARKRS